MKTLKVFMGAFLVGAVIFAGCKKDEKKEATPDIKSTVPEVAATEGAYTVVWNAVDYSDCNGLVFAGNYNGWNTEVENLAAFEKIEGYTNWYKAVIVPTSEITQLEGKPCALAADGTFPSGWDHQWIGSEEKPCELVKGEATFEVEYETETKMIVPTIGGVVYVRSYQFKVNPCVDEPEYEIAFNLTLEQEVADTVKVYVVGDFVENSWSSENPFAYEMTRVDGKTFKIEGIKAKIGREYKYAANGSWDYEMVVAAPSEGDTCSAKSGNLKIADVTMNDVIYGFKNINASICPDEKPEPVEGVMYIKCEAEGWTWKQMAKAEDKEVYTFTTTLLEGFAQVGANINTAAVDDGSAWYPLETGDLVAGDKVLYTYDATVDPATLTIAKAE